MVIQADERIKELRLSRGLTQTELAKIMSVNPVQRKCLGAGDIGAHSRQAGGAVAVFSCVNRLFAGLGGQGGHLAGRLG